MYYRQSHFTDDRAEADRLGDLPDATQHGAGTVGV